MKVLVNYIGTRGAGPVFSVEMIKGLVAQGCDITAIVSKHMENYEEWTKLPIKICAIEPYKNKIDYFINSLLFNMKHGSEIKKIVSCEEYDCIYIPMIQMWSQKVNKLFPNIMKVVTVHDPKPHSNKIFSIRDILYNNVCRKTIKSADKIVILSEVFRKTMELEYGVDSSQIVFIPHGRFSYYQQFTPNGEYEMESDDKVHFLFFGRIEEYKGLHLLYEAYSLLEKEFGDKCDLRIVGNGDFSSYNKEFKNLKNIQIVNRWIKDEEVNSFFQKPKTVVVIPYISASQSGVIPIAMEAKCPIIATNVGGLNEQVTSEETGILCNPDVEELLDALRRPIIDWNTCQNMANRAYIDLENLNWDRLAFKLKEFIKV